MDANAQNETRNLGIAILVPLLALAAMSAYVIYVPEPATADTVVGRLVAFIVLAFFVWNCVLSFQKGRSVSKDGMPRAASEETRISPIWAFIAAVGVLALIVSLSGPSRMFEGMQEAIIGSAEPSSPDAASTEAPTSPSDSAAASVEAESSKTVADTTSVRPYNVNATLQFILTFALAGVLGYFSIHISQLDNKISDRDTALISHSIVYFLVTFLNVIVFGGPWFFCYLAEGLPDYFFNLAYTSRFMLMALGAAVVFVDALRVFSGSYRTMRAIVERARFPLPRRASVNGLLVVFYLIFFLIGRVVLIGINFLISVVVWIYVLLYYFVASCLKVVRTTLFSWALLFALIHSIAFVVLAVALLNAPWSLTHIRSYFEGANDAAWIAIAVSIAGVLLVSVLLAVVAFASAYFSWPTAFLTTIPELIAYTLISVWLNSAGLHLLKGLSGIGPTDFGSVGQLGPTFWAGLAFGIVAFVVALWQSSRRGGGAAEMAPA